MPRLTAEQFVKKAKVKHGDKYDYSKINYINLNTKITIICSLHGEFTQRPNEHMKGSGCNNCGRISFANKRCLTTERFIEKAKAVHGDKYDYSKVVYINTNTKVTIMCSSHGEFKQSPNHHLRKKGCKICSNQFIRFNSSTAQEFIEKANKLHNNKYDYSKAKYVNSKIKIIIICHEHGEFEQRPNDHLCSKGCKKCSYKYKLVVNVKYTRKQFIEKAKLKHGNKYDYSEVDYVNGRTKVLIICKIHGKYKQTPSGHLSNGCKMCGLISSSHKQSKSLEQFILDAKAIHGNKYDYTKVEYIRSHQKIIILCPKHGEFEQRPNDHLHSLGCKKCASIQGGLKNKYTIEEFIEKAKVVHRNKYDYSEVIYRGIFNKITIICPKFHKFMQSPSKHLMNQGCSKCNMCPSCGLWRTMGNLCVYCKPKNNNKLYQKTKEYAIVKYLREMIIDEEFIHNKSVGKDCTDGHLFPDIRFDCITYNLIVEIDEHKHRGASYKCDEQRMYDIIAKLGQPCVFIRYNPDNKDSNVIALLEEINDYLHVEDIDFTDMGLKKIYLYY